MSQIPDDIARHVERRRGKVTIELSRDGWTGGLQLSINRYSNDGVSGDGYRIFGPKFNGTGELLKCHVLDERDIAEIREYLNAADLALGKLVVRDVNLDEEALREATRTRMGPDFNPAYRVSRCGDGATHAPHVVEHGPDQPRNCPGVPADLPRSFAEEVASR